MMRSYRLSNVLRQMHLNPVCLDGRSGVTLEEQEEEEEEEEEVGVTAAEGWLRLLGVLLRGVLEGIDWARGKSGLQKKRRKRRERARGGGG